MPDADDLIQHIDAYFLSEAKSFVMPKQDWVTLRKEISALRRTVEVLERALNEKEGRA